jgi:hypothetical protein
LYGSGPGDGIAFSYGIWNDQRFAQSRTDFALTVANHHQGVKSKAPASFDDFGDAPSVDHSFGESASVFEALPPSKVTSVSRSYHKQQYPRYLCTNLDDY